MLIEDNEENDKSSRIKISEEKKLAILERLKKERENRKRIVTENIENLTENYSPNKKNFPKNEEKILKDFKQNSILQEDSKVTEKNLEKNFEYDSLRERLTNLLNKNNEIKQKFNISTQVNNDHSDSRIKLNEKPIDIFRSFNKEENSILKNKKQKDYNNFNNTSYSYEKSPLITKSNKNYFSYY